jgi:class 3 adenylate cyclase
MDLTADAVEEFITGTRRGSESDRILATVLFTDIVGSTDRAAAMGDRRWAALLTEHHEIVAAVIEEFRGRLIKTTGDGALATFDGPTRAIRCAAEIRERLKGIGIDVRAGLHSGEVELLGDDVGGIGVHIASRILAEAGPGEIVVSGTVRDLAVGSETEFSDRGERRLKGVPGSWKIFEART